MKKQSSATESISNWEDWIIREDMINAIDINFDNACEHAVKKFDLKSKERDPNLIDILQCFLIWWHSNREDMLKYRSYESIARLINKSHSLVIYHIKKRQPTYEYEQNTVAVKTFLRT